MIENWRPVVGYEGLYEVSDQGRVRSVARLVEFKDGRRRLYAGKILKHGFSKGYPRVNLSRGDVAYCALIHQLVLSAFVGPMPEGNEVRHYDGDRENCTLGNLLYGTTSDNYADCVRVGGGNHGERNGQSKLTPHAVRTIREMYKQGIRQREIADFFEIDPSHVSDIKNGYRWGHL